MKSTIALMAFLVSISGTVLGAGEDLQRCLYNNGRPMEGHVCEILRKDAQKKRAEAEVSRRQQAVRNEAYAKQQAEQAAAQAAERQERDAASLVRKQKEEERIAEFRREQDKRDRAEAAEQKAAMNKQALRKAECGADYQTIQIGMQISRAQKCVAPFKLKGQINRADGVVSTYVAGSTYAHVMDGKIVSWGK